MMGEYYAIKTGYKAMMSLDPDTRPFFGGLGLEYGDYEIWDVIFFLSYLICMISGLLMFHQ
jgi:hypothetical protein